MNALSRRDKQAIQIVTRYADVMREVKFEFSIHFGRIRFNKPGTTSSAYFSDYPDDAKAY